MSCLCRADTSGPHALLDQPGGSGKGPQRGKSESETQCEVFLIIKAHYNYTLATKVLKRRILSFIL